jgi:hypothetical protein
MEPAISERLFDKSKVPKPLEIKQLLGMDAMERLKKLDAFLQDNYDIVREFKFPFGNQYGWSYKYSSKGKMLCYIFFEKGAFTVTVTIGKSDLSKLTDELPNMIPKTRELWANRYPCGEGGWIHYRVINDNEIPDIQKLICLKKRPKHAAQINE